MQKIKKAGHLFSLFFRALCWLIPMLSAYFILFHMDFMLHIGTWSSMISDVQAKEILHSGQFSLAHRLIILAIEILGLSMTLLIFHKLAKLFYLYAQGDLFGEDNIKLIKQVGICMIAGQFIHLVYQPLITAALSFNNTAGNRFASLSIGTTNASALITACIILLASWIVQEARQLQSETQLTI